MDDDQWLPGKARQANPLTASARVSGEGKDVGALVDGLDRAVAGVDHAWTGPAGASVTLAWDSAVMLGGLRIVFDSDLNQHKRMPCSVPLKGNRCAVPASLVRHYRVEVRNADGSWRTVCREHDNHQRLVRLPIAAHTTGVRITPEEMGRQHGVLMRKEVRRLVENRLPANLRERVKLWV